MQSLVMLHNGTRGVCVVTEGLREYEIPAQQPQTLAITLFRSVGWLGKPDLLWRPGRASGMALPTPDSQLPGLYHAHFAVLPMAQGQDAAFWRAVEQWRTPASGYLESGWSRFRTNPHGLHFPARYSLLSWDCALHFSTLKKRSTAMRCCCVAGTPASRRFTAGNRWLRGRAAGSPWPRRPAR
ncbi:hypothetical protein P0E69_22825 (plasmid) [Chimaeribacter arupi]|uniref:hypothetical protein n=1 Tax=Chimaeribacter arupi TaxID=2060066 RepID=UPI002711ECD9|nr:hypothetical protein [Chimaeribacter arupi]WKZ94940.1 hypothetical protein P0E69_22825 [Chimaeribacter arupi]